jgi:serine-type D-Ala-D-Ala carboxypeptidase/endopeptidase (penicillin-binding protein 4)
MKIILNKRKNLSLHYTKKNVMRTLLLLFVILNSLWLSAQWDKNNSFQAFPSTKALKNAPTSICVADTKSGEILFTSQPHLCITPASVLKLVTTSAALEMLGAEHRFTTPVWVNGRMESRTVYGNVVITGSGDPSMGSFYFTENGNQEAFLNQWARQLKEKGIDTITGNIWIDPSVFTDQEVPQTWIWEDMANYYGAAAQGISIFDNTFSLHFDTRTNVGDTCTLSKIQPEIPELTIQNKVLASDDHRNNAYLFGSPYDAHRVIRGTLPKGKTNFVVRASIPDPAKLLATLLTGKIKDEGIIVLGEPVTGKMMVSDSIQQQNILFESQSPPLWQIVQKTNHYSLNLYAEALCKHIGLKAKNLGSTQAGCEAIIDYWADKGIDVSNLFLADGSGLSRYNALTAKTLVNILVYMKRSSKNAEYFLASVPLTGIEGTQQYYFSNSFLKGKARAKTGSMTRVRCMAGYMTTQSGKEIAFSIMVNNFNGTSVEISREIETLMEEIYLKN